MNTIFLRLGMCLLLASTSSCTNLFEGSAKKDGDPAKLLEARKKMDHYQWTAAIEQILSLSAEYLAKREVKALLASAYAGRCGLDFLAIADNLKNPGSSNLFEILVLAFPGATAAQVTDCIAAETTLKTISATATDRNPDENLLMAFVSFAKLGVIASNNLDIDGNGLADDGIDPCTALSDSEAAQLVTGVANAIVSLGVVGGTIGGATRATVESACTTLAGIDPDYNICALIDTSQVTMAEHRQAIRGIVSETTGGLGVRFCANGPDLCTPGCGT